MPVRGGDLTQSLDQHYFEKSGPDRPGSVVCSGASTFVESREPLRSGRQCVRFRTNGRRGPGALGPGARFVEGGEGGDSNAHGARHSDARGSYDAPVRTVGESCESRGTPGSLGCCAHSVEAALAGRRHIDWTGEVRNDRLPETNLMRRPMSIVRGATEPSSAIEPRNRARRNFGKCLPPRTNICPRAPRRTISSYTLERVVTTIASRAAHESM